MDSGTSFYITNNNNNMFEMTKIDKLIKEILSTESNKTWRTAYENMPHEMDIIHILLPISTHTIAHKFCEKAGANLLSLASCHKE